MLAVPGAFTEADTEEASVAAGAAGELTWLAYSPSLGGIEIGDRGNLAGSLPAKVART